MALSARSLAPVLDKLKAALRAGPEMPQRVAAHLEAVPKRVTAHLEQLREGGPARVFAELFARGRAPRGTGASRCAAGTSRGAEAKNASGPASRIAPSGETAVTPAPAGVEPDATFRELFDGRGATARGASATARGDSFEALAPSTPEATRPPDAEPRKAGAAPALAAERGTASEAPSDRQDAGKAPALAGETFAELISSAGASVSEPSLAERDARDAALEESSAVHERAGAPRERRSVRAESPRRRAAPVEAPVEVVVSAQPRAKSSRPQAASRPERPAAGRAAPPAKRGTTRPSKPPRNRGAEPSAATTVPAPEPRFARLGAAASAGRVLLVGAQERVPLRNWVAGVLGAAVPWVARGQVGTRGVATVEASLQRGGLAAVVILEGDISHKESERVVATCKKCGVPFAYAGRGSHKALEEAFAKLERELG